MKKPSRLREAALLDIDEALDHYFSEAPHMLTKLESAILEARRHIEHFPGTGSKRYQSNASSDVLRFWTSNKFPYAIFYFERPDYVEIIRVLHQSSNVPAHLEP